jgi:hypothetical protein
MAVKLDFYGGLFLVSPGGGPSQKVEVRMWRPLPVKVEIRGQADTAMERLLNVAPQLDFEGGPSTGPRLRLPIRPLSHVLVVDYQSASKTVTFEGGGITGDGPPVANSVFNLFEEAKRSKRLEDKLQAFRQLSGISGKSDKHLESLAREFFEQKAEELRFWQMGYHITVELSEARVVPSGQAGASYPLADGAWIVFDVEEGSTIPHQPMHNPHVLERPPTRRGGRR